MSWPKLQSFASAVKQILKDYRHLQKNTELVLLVQEMGRKVKTKRQVIYTTSVKICNLANLTARV